MFLSQYVLKWKQRDQMLSLQDWNMCSMAQTSMLLDIETGQERPWIRRQAWSADTVLGCLLADVLQTTNPGQH